MKTIPLRSRLRVLPLVVSCLLTAVPSYCAEFRLSTFSADVTIPIGHPCMGGGIRPARIVQDPLLAKGFVLLGGEKPLVMIAFDWCEIRGTSFDKWKRALAEAAGTEPSRVLVISTHVHDAPVMDEDAEKLLRDIEATGAWKDIPPPDPKAAVQTASVCQPGFNEACIAKVTAALRESLPRAARITHFGAGKAKVDRIASNLTHVVETHLGVGHLADAPEGQAVVFNLAVHDLHIGCAVDTRQRTHHHCTVLMQVEDERD